jgi:iron complex outermembrane receptor protein
MKREETMDCCDQSFLRNLPALLMATLVFHLFSAPSAALAEDARLETITVTAQKQEENVQDVPITISVFSDTALEERGIDDILELSRFTPNMLIRNKYETDIVVRGISVPHQSVLQSNVGFYVDDVNYPITLMQNPDLYDVERIEVLKGPQGTLYGRNSLSGVINIVTRQPDDEARAAITGEYGFYDPAHGTSNSYRLRGSVSGPVVEEKLYIGLAGQLERSDGFMKNVTSNDDEAAEINRLNGRVTLRWTPSDHWDISLIADYLHTDDGYGYNQYFTPGMVWNGTGFSPVDFSTDHHEIAWDGENVWDQESDGQTLRLKYSASAVDILSITGRKRWDADLANDAGISPIPDGDWLSSYDTHAISQELRLSSNRGEARFQWLAGVYGFIEEFDIDSVIALYSDFRYVDIENTGFAVFGQGTYTFFGRLHVTGGLRYDSLELEGDINGSYFNRGSMTVDLLDIRDEDDYSEVLPKASVSYDVTDDIMIYATAAKGYLSGGFNYAFVTSSDNFRYDPEYSWNYELGLKTSWFDNKLGFNVAAFYIDIEDKQIVEYLGGQRNITNAAEAHSAGFELELVARPAKGLELFAGFGCLDAEFDADFDSNGDGIPDTDGKKLPYAPDYNYSLGLQYFHPSGFSGRFEVNYLDNFYSDAANEFEVDGYTLANARIGYLSDNYDVVLWAKNVFNEEYVSNGGPYIYGNVGVAGEPRMVGLTLNYRF